MTYDLDKLTARLTVASRIPETSDAVSLVFSVPKEKEKEFRFGPGQYVTLFLEINGETVPRSYSISSSPAVDQELKVTIKKVQGGKGSTFIMDHVRAGDTIRVSPPAGNFFRTPATPGPHHWVLAAAGSGITPVYSILKTVLHTQPGSRITLLFANRSPDLVIYAKEIALLEEKFKDRLQVMHVMSRPPAGWSGIKGRCEGDLLKELLAKILKNSGSKPVESYLCGPDQFMANLKNGLLEQGVPAAQIHIESFTIAHPGQSHVEDKTPSILAGDEPPGRVYIGDRVATAPNGDTELTVLLGGDELKIPLKPDQTVLEAIIESGGSPPYSCLEGNCMACMAKVREGRVYQNDPGILLDENMKAGETLTCQARPASARIRIDYDSL
jgi:ring-1,2-phenylacetyl-CoA epoxidase subunit PaaE